MAEVELTDEMIQAAMAKADYLVTKDRHLLDLARGRLQFRVVQPQFFEA